MGTGSSRNGNNRGDNRNSGGKTVRKVQNSRFYERENPESNMRRVGRTASDFDESRRSDTSGHERYSGRSDSQSGDNIPEYKSFKTKSHSYTADSEETTSSYSRRRAPEPRSSNDDRGERRRKVDSDVSSQPRKSRLFDDDVAGENQAYDFDATKEEAKARKKAEAADRVTKRREDKRKKAEENERSKDRSFRIRAVARKRDKKIRTEHLIGLSVVILGIFVVLLIVLSRGDYADPFGTAYVSRGSIEFMSDVKLSFIRSESVCKAPASGILVPAVNEGDKVAVGTTVAYITTKEQTALIEELAEVEEKIKTIQKLDSTTTDVISADLEAIDKDLEDLSRRLAEAAASGNMETYSEIKNQIDSLVTKRNGIVNNSQSESSYLNSLLKERELIKQKISVYTQPVVSAEAGIVSFNIDGNETTFTEMSNALSKSASTDVVNISSVSVAGDIKNLVNTQVGAGTVVAKVITSSEYYVAAVADGNITVQQNKPLSVKSKDREFGSEVDILNVTYSAGKTLIIGKTSKSLISSLGSRTLDGDMITGKYEGMKIPLSSLTEFDATGTTARLTLIRSDYVVYAYVNILAKDDEYAIISDKSTFSDAIIKDSEGNEIDVEKTRGVTVNDVFVLKPENVKEGEMIS